MFEKDRENWSITLHTIEGNAYFKRCQKMLSGTKTCTGANSIKKIHCPCQLSLRTAAHNLSQKIKTKSNTILFDMSSKHI